MATKKKPDYIYNKTVTKAEAVRAKKILDKYALQELFKEQKRNYKSKK